MKKLAILTPCYSGYVSYRFMLSLIQTITKVSSVELNFWTIAGMSVLPMARNQLVAKAMAWGADKIVFIDDDISWRPEDFKRLIVAPEHIVAGAYEKKRQDLKDPPSMAISQLPEGMKVGPNGLYAVDGAGTGFMRIDRCVFEDLKSKCVKLGMMEGEESPAVEAELYEYFMFGRLYKDNKTFLDGEDYNFCRKARDVGYKTYVDADIHLGHNTGPLEFNAKLETTKIL